MTGSATGKAAQRSVCESECWRDLRPGQWYKPRAFGVHERLLARMVRRGLLREHWETERPRLIVNAVPYQTRVFYQIPPGKVGEFTAACRLADSMTRLGATVEEVVEAVFK